MKIKVSTAFTGVIATGSYENARPSYAVEAEFDVPEEYQNGKLPEFIALKQQELQGVCFNNFKQDEQRQIIDRIQKERADMRFYGEYPSVTSIIGWDADMFVSPVELQQYASQGNLYDLQAKNYIKTGEWLPAEKIEGSWADLVILKQGSLKLSANGWDFPAFLKKYPIEKMEVGKPVISKAHKFAGTPDIRVCYFEGKKYLADVKRTPDKVKHFKQCAAYVIAEEENGEKPYDGLMLIPANGEKTQQGFSKPVCTFEIAQYKDMFLKDREAFLKRFGI